MKRFARSHFFLMVTALLVLGADYAYSGTCSANCGNEKQKGSGWLTIFAGKKKCYETLPQASLFDATIPSDASATASGEGAPSPNTKSNGSSGVR